MAQTCKIHNTVKILVGVTQYGTMSYIFKQVNDFGVIFHDHFSWYHYEIFHVRWRFTKLSRNLQITA